MYFEETFLKTATKIFVFSFEYIKLYYINKEFNEKPKIHVMASSVFIIHDITLSVKSIINCDRRL